MPHRVIERGTILIPSGPSTDPDRKHLFVICTEPCEKGHQVLVPITNWTNHLCDGTCILKPGVHAFVHKESYILYRKATIYEYDVLCKGVEEGLLIPKDPCDEEPFLRVKNGLCLSPHTPRKIKIYLKCPATNIPSTLSKPDAPALRKQP